MKYILTSTLILALSLLTFSSTASASCADGTGGFSTDPADFGPPNVDILPETPLYPFPAVTLTRGDVEYSGFLSARATGDCEFNLGVPSICGLQPGTAVPVVGTIWTDWAANYVADSTLNPFQVDVTLASGGVDSWAAAPGSPWWSFVGYCAPDGDSIAQLVAGGHDAAIYGVIHDTGNNNSCDLDSLEADITALDVSWEQGLLAKILAARAMIDRGKTVPAANQLAALINQLEAKRDNGSLDASDADPLIECVQTVIDGL